MVPPGGAPINLTDSCDIVQSSYMQYQLLAFMHNCDNWLIYIYYICLDKFLDHDDIH